MLNRGTSSLITYKLERLVESEDVPGLQNHFWGYLTQGFIGNMLRGERLRIFTKSSFSTISRSARLMPSLERRVP